MTIFEIKQLGVKTYPVLRMEKWLRRQSVIRAGSIMTYVVLVAVLVVVAANTFSNLEAHTSKALGVLLFVSGIKLGLFALFAFHNAYYFKGVHVKISSRGEISPEEKIGYSAAQIVAAMPFHDMTKGFVWSVYGFEIILRLGISVSEISKFLKNREKTISLTDTVVEDPVSERFGIVEMSRAVYENDKEFQDFLLSKGIVKEDLIQSALWVTRVYRKRKSRERWWSKDRLSRIPGLGKEWSYGKAFALERYALPVPSPSYGTLEYEHNRKEVEKIEEVLIRGRESNALVISDDISRRNDIVAGLNRLIQEGSAAPQLEHARIIIFDTDAFSASNPSKAEYERELMKVMRAAEKAGNIILAIPDFPSWLRGARAYDVDLMELIDLYLLSSNLHIVALAGAGSYHDELEANERVRTRFEKIQLESVGVSGTIAVLEDEAGMLEYERNVLFTYPALKTIMNAAEQYFPDATMPDSAIDLMFDVASKSKGTITKEHVMALVENKTGIPTGEIKTDEKDKLQKLESILHERIVGQDQAISGVADALRRARSGINNPNRPMGSFLFLGPTGVGKTETAKALAALYFGDESYIERVDMSEYSSADALEKLIGSFAAGRPGVLSKLMRENPYGVLLLDEFEKTTSDVMNLFLQILDEGFFSDMSGKKVNVRNHIIIATSNAGSDLIWNTIQKGEDLQLAKNTIIDALVEQGIYKPELLNRFDGIILFHPLQREMLKEVARKELAKLSKRLMERGIRFEPTDDVVNYLVEQGSDPKFGARSLNRAIQDTVESAIAARIVSGETKMGEVVELTTEDLQKATK